jgi:hypothetical protein
MNPAPSPLMTASDPIFWMGCSLLLVAVSLTAVAVVAVPVVQEMVHVSRSAGRLLDTLDRELPRTLEALRATGSDLSNLQKDVNRGVQNAANVVEQVDRSLVVTKQQVSQVQITAKGFLVGFKAAWRTFQNSGQPPLSSNDLSSEDANHIDRLSEGHKTKAPFDAAQDQPLTRTSVGNQAEVNETIE